MQFRKLFFKGAGGHRLSARLDLPDDGSPVACAIFAHCFTCTKNIKAAANISQALTRRGFAVFRFDFTGLGESGGDFADTNFSSNVEDLLAAAAYLDADGHPARILIGHSLGGAAVLQAASRIPTVAAVVTIGAPSSPGHLIRHLGEARGQIEREGEAAVAIEGKNFTIKKQFLEDLKDTRMEAAIQSLGCALLILHSPVDDIVGVDNAARIFAAARHPKSFIALDRADHLLADRKDSNYAGALIAEWALRYI